jgi:hypothetical protein
MSYNSLIELQKENLFEIPINKDTSDKETVNILQSGGAYENLFDIGNDSIKDEEMMAQNRKDAFNDAIQFGGDLSSSKVDVENDILSNIGNDFESQSGGGIETVSESELFDKIELKREPPTDDFSEVKMSGGGNTKINFESIKTAESKQFGGSLENFEGMEISEITDDLTEETLEEGNINNPGEDLMKTDYESSDKIEEDMRDKLVQPPPAWIHPDLNMEEYPEMIVKLNPDEIESKVANHINNYNSDEYSKYIKYYQGFYAASTQKYSIRINDKGELYLIKRPPIPKELKNKKIKESVQDIINDKSYEKDYLIKLTPPEYLNIKSELENITKELNIITGSIKLLKDELIDLGSDISSSDIKKFEKLRDKFYKLSNKKFIYTKYFEEVNSIVIDEEKINIETNEIISYTDDNDVKSYKLESRLIKASNSLISDITTGIKESIVKYENILELDSENEKLYKSNIKDFLENKNKNNIKISKELKDLITFSKPKVNFLIKKLPKIDIKNDVLFTEKIHF